MARLSKVIVVLISLSTVGGLLWNRSTRGQYFGTSTQTRVPSDSNITVLLWQRGLMAADPACERSLQEKCNEVMFPLDFLRISKLFNPRANFVMLVDDTLDESPHAYFNTEVAKLHVTLVSRATYRSENSRSSVYARLHSENGVKHDADMMARFCEWSDLTAEHGFKRVLTIDSDVALFADVNKVYSEFTEDVVTPCASCSQVVLWRPGALSAFCDAHIEYLALKGEVRSRIHERFGDVGRWNDMEMLLAFIYEQRWARQLGFTVVTQLDERATQRNPHPVAWIAGLTIQMYRVDGEYRRKILQFPNQDCKDFDQLFGFEQLASSPYFPLFVPIVKFGNVSYVLPVMHFHQRCKINHGHRVYLKYYAAAQSTATAELG